MLSDIRPLDQRFRKVKVSMNCWLLGSLLTTFFSGVMSAIDTSWSVPTLSDYLNHPCRRDCQQTSPMICEYNFTVEHYQTFSRACYNCPHNITDCDRPHCVPADGFIRAIKVVNRMMPGPSLHVCKDDTIVVNVHNHLGDFEGTAIHWHGVLQEGTPYMDGVAMVTQCPINVHSVFQYRFQVTNSGTHYWHAHAGLQRGDGIFGALVVRDTSYKKVMVLYDHDLPEHTIILQDWLDQYTSSKFSLHHHSSQDNEPTSILINGRGTKFGQKPAAMMTHGDQEMNTTQTGAGNHTGHSGMDTTTVNPHAGHMKRAVEDPVMNMNASNQESFVPHTVFRVSYGKAYRFRLISNGVLNCPLKVSIENHTLVVIATDGNDIEPKEVDTITLFAGERFDVVLKANRPKGNYWMHVIGLFDCQTKNVSQTAIIRYQGAKEMKPMTGQGYSDGDRPGLSGNSMLFTADTVTVAEMTSNETADEVYTAHNVKKFYMSLGYNEVENYHFLDPTYYPLSAMYEVHTGSHGNHLFALQMNNITFKTPMSPVLSQFDDFSEEMFCNQTSPPKMCSREFCECVHRIKVSVDDIVELVLISDGMHGPGNHPMHMHGHRFYVLGMEKFGNSVSRELIQALDAKGKLKRNLRNPIQKDTVLVPDGGYTVIRFKATNPGFWMFHCHVDFHFALGMSVVFQVGEVHEMPSTPRGFPRCGSWRFSEDSSDFSICSKYLNCAIGHFTYFTLYFGLFMFSVLKF